MKKITIFGNTYINRLETERESVTINKVEVSKHDALLALEKAGYKFMFYSFLYESLDLKETCHGVIECAVKPGEKPDASNIWYRVAKSVLTVKKPKS